MPGRVLAIAALFVVSGAAGLSWQVVWTRMLAVWLGHEVQAVVSVIAAFLGGMALGAWTLRRRASRAADPARLFASLELVAAAWGAATAVAIPAAGGLAMGWVGVDPSPARQAAVSFAVPFLVFLPSTAALGASFLAMERWLSAELTGARTVGAVYAASTLGAMAGVLAVPFVAIPSFGIRGTLFLLAGASAACALGALALSGRPAPAAAGSDAQRAGNPEGRGAARILLATGLLGIGYEALCVRVLACVLENTVYTFAAVLAAYLGAAALGAALWQRLGRSRPFGPLLSDLLLGTAAATLAGIWGLAHSAAVRDAARGRLGDGVLGSLAAELLAAIVALGPAAVLMGALFSHLAQRVRDSGRPLGEGLAANYLGGAAGAAVFTVLLLPAVGARWAILLAGGAYAALCPRAGGRRLVAGGALLVGGAVLAPGLRILDVPPGGAVLEYRDGVLASVAVVETPGPDRDRTLRVNNRFQMGGTGAAAARTEARQAHIPLLLHPAPRRALFLGTGTGTTACWATAHPGLEVEGVELLPEVAAVMPWFRVEGEPPGASRAAFRVADARRFVRASREAWDAIVADVFHPAVDGAGALYTREHFEAVRARLSPGGVFCQWLPLYQLDLPTLRSIVRTFLAAFPAAEAWLLHFSADIPVLGLVAGDAPPRLSPRLVEERSRDPILAAALARAQLDTTMNLLGCFLAGPTALAAFAGDAPLNADDRPVVAFGAPRGTRALGAAPHRTLLGLLDALAPGPFDRLGGEGAETFSGHLRGFAAARDLYLRGLVDEASGDLGRAADRYLESAGRSLWFTPAYARSIAIIRMLAPADLPRARELFRRLEEVRPDQPLGRKMLGDLLGS